MLSMKILPIHSTLAVKIIDHQEAAAQQKLAQLRPPGRRGRSQCPTSTRTSSASCKRRRCHRGRPPARPIACRCASGGERLPADAGPSADNPWSSNRQNHSCGRIGCRDNRRYRDNAAGREPTRGAWRRRGKGEVLVLDRRPLFEGFLGQEHAPGGQSKQADQECSEVSHGLARFQNNTRSVGDRVNDVVHANANAEFRELVGVIRDRRQIPRSRPHRN